MTPKAAAFLFGALAAVVAAFHAALALGAPWGKLTWGGKYPGRLPASMRAAAVFSMALLLGFALIVAVRAGVAWPEWHGASKYLVWGVVGYCGLGVIANAITPSRWERILWLPVVVAMLACSLMVATGP